MKTRWTMMLAALLLAGCNDTLTDDILSTADNDGDGDLLFSVSTLEQADMTVGVGTTCALGDSAMRLSDTFVAHQLTGSNPDGLTIHRMPLPYMGIHHGTVSARSLCSDTVTASSTRAHKDAIVTTALNNFHDSLTIWGYTSQPYKTTGANDAENSTIFNQTLLKRIRNWRSSVHWPYGGDKMKFYALAPSMENVNVIKSGTPDFSTPPTITYTLPENATEMRDLLWGESDIVDVEAGPTGTPLYPGASTPREQHLGQDDKMVDMTFQHILTAIRFAQGNIPTGITIKKITLHNVPTQGTFNPSATDAATGTNGAWSNDSTKADYSLWPNTAGSGTTANTYIDHDSLFFMIPHTVTDAELQVTIEVKPKYQVDANGVYIKDASGNYIESVDNTPAVAHTLKCSLAGDVWKKGYTVTYKLTVGEVADGYYLVAENPTEAEHNSTSSTNGTFAVHSYRSYYDYAADEEVTTHGVNWEVAGYSTTEPNENTKFEDSCPSWLTNSSGTPGINVFAGGYDSQASYTITAQSYTKSGNHAAILGKNTTNERASNWNLYEKTPNGDEIPTGQRKNANCYIVNREGTYTFPLVYGNKASDGVEADCFVDHKGTRIAYRDIKSQMDYYEETVSLVENESRKRTSYSWQTSTISNRQQTIQPVLVWQDVSGLVTNLTITTSNIGFEVAQSTPGNAVIALQGRTETVYEKSTDSGSNWIVDTDKGTGGYEYGDWETFWTWHIWMTDEVYPNEGSENGISDDTQFLNYNGDGTHAGDHLVSITNYSNSSATILPVNLGWVPDENEFGFYSKRECWVKLRQVAPMTGVNVSANQSCVVHIVQHAKQNLITGTSTVYQWGRPTALPMTATTATITATQDFLLHPEARVLQSGEDYWTTGQDYWGGTKTVYDPCPPGFRVPDGSIFTGFSLTGTDDSTGEQLNLWSDNGSATGGYFYTTLSEADRYGDMVYMPAAGYWTLGRDDNKGFFMDVKPQKPGGYIEFSEKTANGAMKPIRPCGE